MNDNLWRISGNPEKMLQRIEDQASERKLRLFALACCEMLVLPLGIDPDRIAHEAIRRVAEGEGTVQQLDAVREVCAQTPGFDPVQASFDCPPPLLYRTTLWSAAVSSAWEAARAAMSKAASAIASGARRESRDAHAPERWRLYWYSHAMALMQIADLLREIFGPSPSSPPTVDPFWRSHQDHVVLRLARGIDQRSAHVELPILADALEDAGCSCEVILSHCRQTKGHVPGCWVLDLLLGRS